MLTRTGRGENNPFLLDLSLGSFRPPPRLRISLGMQQNEYESLCRRSLLGKGYDYIHIHIYYNYPPSSGGKASISHVGKATSDGPTVGL